MTDILLCIFGAILVGSVAVRLFFPLFGLSESLIACLEERNSKKRFLAWHNINGFLLGAILIAAGILPEELKLCCCLPPLVGVFISVILCNRVCVATFWAYVPKIRQKK